MAISKLAARDHNLTIQGSGTVAPPKVGEDLLILESHLLVVSFYSICLAITPEDHFNWWSLATCTLVLGFRKKLSPTHSRIAIDFAII